MATVSDYLLERLSEWGVDTVFGYPGDGINGLMGALNRAGGRIRFIQARHEEMAAFEAVGYSKFGDRLGVCMATSGPGAIHLLNGLYDAKMDHVPVLAIVGQQARTALGGHYQQEVDLATLYKDVASEFVQMATAPEQIRHLIDRAARAALAERTATCVIVPNDLQELPSAEPPRKHGTLHSGVGYTPGVTLPRAEELDRAAGILNAGERVAILIGQGARGAGGEVAAVAERLGAGVAKALLGKDVLPDELPYVTGAIGLLGTKPSWDMMMECDTLLMVGSSFPYAEFLPKEGQARGVQIDHDARMINIRYPMEVGLIGDSRATLAALLERLEHKPDRGWRERLERSVAGWWDDVAARAEVGADPINPQKVFAELSPRLPDDVMLAADSGTVADWYARDLRLRAGMRGSLSGTLATMGAGVPYAIGAKFAHPDRPAIALMGDGAMQMNGTSELLTIGKYWRTWSDPRLIVLVLHNNDLNQVTWEQRAMNGDPKFEASQDLPEFSYAAAAEAAGLAGIAVDRPEDVGAAWDHALASDRPIVLDVRTDPDVPPLPPHITLEQARAFTSAVVHGDPDRVGLITQSVKEKMADLLPGGRR
jgi:pyruvate dehydrogenase (quinone)